MKQLKGDTQEFINRSKHRRCISSVLQLNRNSIEFSLSTQTRRVIKSPQAKSLHSYKFLVSNRAFLYGLYNKCYSTMTSHYVTNIHACLYQHFN